MNQTPVEYRVLQTVLDLFDDSVSSSVPENVRARSLFAEFILPRRKPLKQQLPEVDQADTGSGDSESKTAAAASSPASSVYGVQLQRAVLQFLHGVIRSKPQLLDFCREYRMYDVLFSSYFFFLDELVQAPRDGGDGSVDGGGGGGAFNMAAHANIGAVAAAVLGSGLGSAFTPTRAKLQPLPVHELDGQSLSRVQHGSISPASPATLQQAKRPSVDATGGAGRVTSRFDSAISIVHQFREQVLYFARFCATIDTISVPSSVMMAPSRPSSATAGAAAAGKSSAGKGSGRADPAARPAEEPVDAFGMHDVLRSVCWAEVWHSMLSCRLGSWLLTV
mgnify:CR=1 FL=1